MLKPSLGAIGPVELATLEHIASESGNHESTVPRAELIDSFDAPRKTVLRRLDRLEHADLIEYKTADDEARVVLKDVSKQVLGLGQGRADEEEDERGLIGTEFEMEFEGTVTSGVGRGSHFVSLSGYHRQFVDCLGYEPYPGTLNIALLANSVLRRDALESLTPIRIDGWEDGETTYGWVDCYPAAVEAQDGGTYDDCHVIVPERANNHRGKLELVAGVELRDELGLEDSDFVRIHVGNH